MRIILAIFSDRFEVYGSLKPFFEQYPQYAELKDKIDYTMSRKKLPFEHSDFKLQLAFEETIITMNCHEEQTASFPQQPIAKQNDNCSFYLYSQELFQALKTTSFAASNDDLRPALQQNMKNKQKRIHPTEKPIQLYKWLLQNYAKQGDKILDTHFGSLSIGIACHDMGFELTAIELDKDYYEAGKKRLMNHQRQLTIF